MKTLVTTLMLLFIAVGLSAVTELINFNNTSNLTDLFNHGTGTAITNFSTGGLSNSGAANIPLSSNDIWTHKTGFAVPAVGQTATVSAYFKIVDNSGYSGIGFAQANVNEETAARVTTSSALGMMFHGGGGGFFNNASSYPVTWFGTSGDLRLGNWYNVIFTITNQGTNSFDLAFQIWNSDSNGVLGTLFTSQSRTGVQNSTIAGLPTIYPYFTNAGSRSGKMDDFYVQITEPEPPSDFSGGTGTPASPYVITTPDQLNMVRNYLNSSFILGNDIDLNVSPYNTGAGWVPIGDRLLNYTMLDLSLATGGYFTITGMGMWDEPVTTDLISVPTNADIIEMMIMEADIMCMVYGLSPNKFALTDCISINLGSVTGTVDTYDVISVPFSGNFDGNGKTISNLYINQPSRFSSGLFGTTDGSTLTDITLSGVNIDGRGTTGSLIGVGENTVLNNCHSSGTVSAESWVGGLAGYLICDVPMEISNCSSSGTVMGSSSVGGLFSAVHNYTLRECFSTSSVTCITSLSITPQIFGGLVGSCNDTNIINCFARGSVTTDYGINVGGLAGWSYGSSFTNCYSTGAVTSSSSYKGGLFGYTYTSSASDCYWDTVTSGLSNATGNVGGATATGCNTDDMTSPYNAFSGWDFTTIWIEDVYPLNGGYPMLRLLAPDYLNGNEVPVGETVVTVTGGNAYIGSGNIPEFSSLAFVPNRTFTFVGTGVLTITISTPAQFGAYWQSGAWHIVSNSGGNVTFVIDFTTLGKGEIPVVLGDEENTLPVELSSFTAIATQQNYVRLNWVTQSETGVFGYYIYRNTTNELSGAQIVSNMISATNTSQLQSYSFTDQEVTVGTWYYWLQDMEIDGSVNFHGSITINLNAGTDTGTPVIPLVTSLKKIYPNPFNPSTTIAFGLAKTENVKIVIYNVRGQLIRTLLSETKQSDTYRLNWNGTNDQGQVLPSGVYYIKMSAGKYHTTQKLVILK
jgi:hypothetical protein